jgi:carboxyl-terminal processing protease
LPETQQPVEIDAPRPKRSGRRWIAIAVGFLVTFMLGLGIGNGSVTFGTPRYATVSKELPANLSYVDVERLYDSLRKSFDGQLKEKDLIEGLKKGLVNAAGDQYTQYLSPEEAREFNEDLTGTFSGIGARLMQDENEMVMIEVPLAGYPAEKAGLKARDIIIEINGKSTEGLSVNEAVEKIRGKEGTAVKLTVIRDKKQQLTFEITRATITTPSVETKMEGDVGYMQVARFDNTTARLAKKAAEDFRAAGVKGVILDLRNNPGGTLNAAVDLSSLWLSRDKTILQEKRDGVVIKTYDSSGTAVLQGVSTVVLINEGSASASEIVAGALKDNGAATLMGEKSFGKGSVQTVEELPNGGILKVTIARWFRPNGKNIDKEGIEPDQKVTRTEDELKTSKDSQKDAALRFLRK